MKTSAFAFAAMALFGPGVAFAQDGGGDWSVEVTAGVVSDYRYRGLSLSGGDPAVQAGATLSHGSGFYADVYVSSIEEYGIGDDGEGSTLETTLTLGWAGAWLGLDWDAGLAAYRYPGGEDVDYVEVPVQASRTFGAATATLGVSYAPEQGALGHEDNRYVWTGLDYAPEDWLISLTAAVGYEDGAWAPDGKTDWRLGGFLPLGGLTVAVEWVDSDADKGAVVASVFARF